MATSIGIVEHILKITKTPTILVVGAGGIGCELVKNLVLTGFHNIHLFDLDTIELSNLNRQFLFHKIHVGQPKSVVARESVLRYNPLANVKAYHQSITNPDYNVNFFKQFDLVLNALDNRAARSHVNRLCLAANKPLIESGSAGYLGQVEVIQKGLSECYECKPKPAQKTYAGCTIRNTPSELIHCIVWSKHLFNQLFGEPDIDEEVSPDTADPELTAEACKVSLDRGDREQSRRNTREWAESTDYDSRKLFKKLFHDDILYLLTMSNLWKKRTPPTPLDAESQPDQDMPLEQHQLKEQRVWSPKECVRVFTESVNRLREAVKISGTLEWDKDDETAMDFVASTANLRARIFSIATSSRFTIKSMAGNIIPAIATTNAIIAGVMVLEALKILNSDIKKCKNTFLSNRVTGSDKRGRKLLTAPNVVKPNPHCYVCSSKPEVTLRCDLEKVTNRILRDRVLKGQLSMIAPDVGMADNSGTILISSDAEETEAILDWTLKSFGLISGSQLIADDFSQNFTLVINLDHREYVEHGEETSDQFEIIGERPSDNTNVLNGEHNPLPEYKRKMDHTAEEPGPSKKFKAACDDILELS